MITIAAAADKLLADVMIGRYAGSPPVIYHHGNLARDRKRDKALAELADKLLELSDGRFDVVSKCGHIRGHIVGQGRVRLVQRTEGNGITAYVAVKRDDSASADLRRD